MDAGRPTSGPVALVAAGVVLGLGVGWFALSHWVMDTAVADALGEAVGVVLALSIVASAVGAMVSSRRGCG